MELAAVLAAWSGKVCRGETVKMSEVSTPAPVLSYLPSETCDSQDDAKFVPLMADLADVPLAYIKQMGTIKRLLERWTMDDKFREAFEEDAQAAIRTTGLSVTPEEIIPLIDKDEAIKLTRAIQSGETDGYPLSILRYREFYREKRKHRKGVRERCQSSNAKIAAWRTRQINRCAGVLGLNKADALVHAPMALELAVGCTVGCWFCGVEAPKFQHWWEYNDEHAELWQGTLQVMKEVVGPCVREGFMYWATDPLDNPDYEHFLVDFHKVTGKCPQTTTALGAKDVERTRGILELSHSLGSSIDRFSIINLRMLDKLHEAFLPEEFIRVECIPQNRESADNYVKANAGRARRFKKKAESKKLMPRESGSTIACVSGFLFNMPERKVQLVTPCNADERWPLGYWVVAEGTFQDPDQLRDWLNKTINEKMPFSLPLERELGLRPDLESSCEGNAIVMKSEWLKVTLPNQTNPELVLNMLNNGTHSTLDIALERERIDGVPLEETFLLLGDMFQKGFFDEDPRKEALERVALQLEST